MKYFCFALFFLCFILLGCGRNDKLRDADVLRIDVEFESRCSVLANGVRYDFDGLSTAYKIRRRYFRARKIVFKGIDRVQLDDIRAFEDYEPLDPVIMVCSYAAIDKDGVERDFDFYPPHFPRGRGRLMVFAESGENKNLASVISPASVSNTYLIIRCEFGRTSGARIMEIVDKYYACTASRQKFYVETMDTLRFWEVNQRYFERKRQRRNRMILYRR